MDDFDTTSERANLIAGILIGCFVGVLFVLLIQSARDYGAIYEISQESRKWQTYRQPEFDANNNWRFQDIQCNCEVILAGGFTIRRIK